MACWPFLLLLLETPPTEHSWESLERVQVSACYEACSAAIYGRLLRRAAAADQVQLGEVGACEALSRLVDVV